MSTTALLARRLTLSILMPCIMLLSQQGALMHGLSHWHPVSISSDPEARSLAVDHDICVTCLGFAQIGGLAKFDALPAPKVDSFRYRFAWIPLRHVAELALPVARSRGPPTSV